MLVGERIKQLRENAGFSQNRLAEWSGISQTHLRRVELKQQDITVGQLQLVCDGLGITLTEFFSEENNADELISVLAKLSPKQKNLLTEFFKSIYI